MICDVCGEDIASEDVTAGIEDAGSKPGLWVRWGCAECPANCCSADHYEEHMGREHGTKVIWDETA